MNCLPRTLFHRNLLLIVLLIVLGQIGNALVYRQYVMKPRIRQSATAIAQNLQAAGMGLRALPADQRAQFVAAFNQRTAVPASESPKAQGLFGARTPTGRLTSLEQLFIDEVAHQLALGGDRLKWRREASGSLALSVNLNGDGYWVDMPGLVPGRRYSTSWLLASVGAGLLALLGAWLIQQRINQPLQDLVLAVQTLARGDQPVRLAESGPLEIATVAHGFNEMVDALSRNERERMLMLAGLSYDLRTPLAKMRLATEMLQGKGDAELLSSLERNIVSLDELLSQFLTFARLSNAQWDQEARLATDLNALVRDVLALQPQAHSPADGAALIQFRAGPIDPMPLQQQAMQRLIENLLTNAKRHGAPPIEVATGADRQGTWLEVRDRGPGIPPDRVEALKAPFARGQASRSGSSGAGLGLAIVARIAAAHDARFELLPRANGGIVARITLPHFS